MNKYSILIQMMNLKESLVEVYDDSNDKMIMTTLKKMDLNGAFIEAQETIEEDYMKKIGAHE